MAVQNRSEGTRQKDTSKRQERANRILDTAAALILRWGYNKTAIEDIARQAGVAKGTIYLHWRTRDELFEALVIREGLKVAEDIKQSIAEDPTRSTLRGVVRSSAIALMKRPLLKAVLLRDPNVLGKLANSTKGTAIYAEKLAGLETFIGILREHELVRSDLSPRAFTYTLSAIIAGFFLVAPMMPEGSALPDQELADLLAETVHQALEPRRPVTPEEAQIVSDAFRQYLDRYTAVLQQQLRQEVGGIR